MFTIIFTAEGVRARPCDAEEEMTVRAKLVVPGRRRKKCPWIDVRLYSPLFLAFSLIFLSFRKMHKTELAAKLRMSGHLRSDVSAHANAELPPDSRSSRMPFRSLFPSLLFNRSASFFL